MMDYFKPEEVVSPKDVVSDVHEVYDGGAFSISIVKLKWNGEDSIGARWNTSMREQEDESKLNGNKKCVGMPTSRGIPVWFLLPDELMDRNSDVLSEIEKSLNR